LEPEHDVVWSRSVRYDLETILRRIKALPCSFLIDPFILREILPVLESVASFEYSYAEHHAYDWHPEKYTPEQLGPQWDLSAGLSFHGVIVNFWRTLNTMFRV
jgi:hypothetical protein